MVRQIALSSRENSETDIWSEKNLSDLEYADDDVLLSGDPNKSSIDWAMMQACFESV